MCDYEILCYRVMWRKADTDSWLTEDYSTEEKALDFFKKVLNDGFTCKMLKIQALADFR